MKSISGFTAEMRVIGQTILFRPALILLIRGQRLIVTITFIGDLQQLIMLVLFRIIVGIYTAVKIRHTCVDAIAKKNAWTKPEKFNDHGCFETFLAQFEKCSTYNGWNNVTKLLICAGHLLELQLNYCGEQRSCLIKSCWRN